MPKCQKKKRLAPFRSRFLPPRGARGVLRVVAAGPFALDAEQARHTYGWTDAECWALYERAMQLNERGAERQRAKRGERA